MRHSRRFLLTFFAGFSLVWAAAALFPAPEHLRYPSLSAVQPDGGRQEDFVIRWPEDRLALPEALTPLPADAAAGAMVLEDSAGRRVSAEQFRVRDGKGDVIGIAARLAGTGGAVAGPGRSASNWLIAIPSRGTLLLAQSDSLDVTARQRLGAGGPEVLPPAVSASFWSDRQRLRVTASAPASNGLASTGRLVAGTREFAELTGRYTETWELDATDSSGTTRGRILLSTSLAASE